MDLPPLSTPPAEVRTFQDLNPEERRVIQFAEQNKYLELSPGNVFGKQETITRDTLLNILRRIQLKENAEALKIKRLEQALAEVNQSARTVVASVTPPLETKAEPQIPTIAEAPQITAPETQTVQDDDEKNRELLKQSTFSNQRSFRCLLNSGSAMQDMLGFCGVSPESFKQALASLSVIRLTKERV